jgi:uncharacterized protein YdeI (YjbR/CyaY-like superfamily)
MPATNPKVDAYIAAQADFARPILTRLRQMVHESCPDARETIKWGVPHFEHKGLLCGMAAFKAHATFGFWKHALVVGDNPRAREAMGSFGRITSVEQLPAKKKFAAWMKKAIKLNEEGVKSPREKAVPKPPIPVPASFRAALATNARASAAFEALPPGCRREYLEWIVEARREETRARRIAATVAQLAEGKRLHEKYQRGKKP